jgi:hypothetical protein
VGCTVKLFGLIPIISFMSTGILTAPGERRGSSS